MDAWEYERMMEVTSSSQMASAATIELAVLVVVVEFVVGVAEFLQVIWWPVEQLVW